MIRRENWLFTEKYLKEGIRETNPRIKQSSIDRYEFALRHLLIWADDKTFEDAYHSANMNFVQYVANLPARNGGGNLSTESQRKVISVSKKFLLWARDNKVVGARKLTDKALNTFLPPIVTASYADGQFVTIEEVRKLAQIDCDGDLVLMRDIAALCLTFLTGARPKAIATAPIKAIDIEDRTFYQDPKLGVHTKNGKTGISFLLPIDDLIKAVKRWDDYVRANLPETAVWYAPVENHWGDYTLLNKQAGEYDGIDLKKRFRKIYELANMASSYKSPRLYRHGFVLYCLSRCKSTAEYHAASNNIMHSNMVVTDQVYATMGNAERKRIILSFTPDKDLALDNDAKQGCMRFKPESTQDLKQFIDSLDRDDRKAIMHILADRMND